ncbi:hypothetical protein COV06_03060 [Candidatus Uhrbacteria bacterium CG10_big_fil_rev_8_21_14_0_10_50_16]|uniref:Uncharacterized protein n=1 Tax=Candidatus Uhrbacteria bacterium CG10_big_fil_rev_8_21_14_0_10_50_16 TaxID=1975039 RepID=A0A2H0RNS2_9BACT|nr:MAG: hypothetical protein COV06_03060 [Candidatus Uhrbacteria bacterium CG10_big_fil_rev_8_21_14_0_10_50_16]
MPHKPIVRYPVRISGLSEGTTAELQFRQSEGKQLIGVILRLGNCSAVRWAAFPVHQIKMQIRLMQAIEKGDMTLFLKLVHEGHHVVLVCDHVEYRIHLPAELPSILFAA